MKNVDKFFPAIFISGLILACFLINISSIFFKKIIVMIYPWSFLPFDKSANPFDFSANSINKKSKKHALITMCNIVNITDS